MQSVDTAASNLVEFNTGRYGGPGSVPVPKPPCPPASPRITQVRQCRPVSEFSTDFTGIRGRNVRKFGFADCSPSPLRGRAGVEVKSCASAAWHRGMEFPRPFLPIPGGRGNLSHSLSGDITLDGAFAQPGHRMVLARVQCLEELRLGGNLIVELGDELAQPVQ